MKRPRTRIVKGKGQVFSGGAATSALPTLVELHATTATFAAQIAAAPAGAVILLATGNYGTWTGTNKAITIVPEAGANPVMALNLGNGAANFTIDGGHTEISPSTNGMVRQTSFTSSGIQLGASSFTGTPGPQNITIRRCWMGPDSSGAGGFFEIDGPTNTNILIDCCRFFQINDTWEACIRWSYTGNAVMTIKNCLLQDSSADGLKIGAQLITVTDCEFDAVHPHGNAALHTDMIQFLGGTDDIVRRCYFHNFEQACSGFDGMSNCTIEDNVVQAAPYGGPAHWISCMGDDPGSTVNHNTVVDGLIYLSSKTGFPPSTTFVRNNISSGGIGLSGSGVTGTPSQDTNNMFISGASSPDINGTAVYVGGATPTTWQGFKLAVSSPGRNAANDGLDVGARIS